MLLVPPPCSPQWLKNAEGVQRHLEWLHQHACADTAHSDHHRGRYVSLPAGCGFGVGRVCPGNYANSNHNTPLIEETLADPDVQHVARYVDGA